MLLGGYYALIAAGLSFMFQVMRIINLAHGSLAVLAAFALFVLIFFLIGFRSEKSDPTTT